MLIFDWLLSLTVVFLADLIYVSEASQNPNLTRPSIQTVPRVDDDTPADAKPRIVGGEPAKLRDFPWMASLKYENTTYSYACSASIINPSTILTAAHCVSFDSDQKYGDFSINAGNLKYYEVERFEQKIRAKEVFVHPEYDDNVFGDYDLAVLKLRKPLRTNKRVQSVELPKLTRAKSLLKRNNCVVIGYGYTSYGDYFLPSILQKAEVTILSKRQCSQIFPGFKFGQQFLCTNHIGRGVCFGDSGGPLVCYDKKDRAHQVGITSLTRFCDGGSIYVSVARMLNWIQKYY